MVSVASTFWRIWEVLAGVIVWVEVREEEREEGGIDVHTFRRVSRGIRKEL